MTKQEEERIYTHMINDCHYTEQQAKELIEFDKAVDRGEIGVYDDLTDEQRKVIKKATSVYDTPKASAPKTRKADNDKELIISKIVDALSDCKIEIVNKEREINIVYNDRQFKLLLTATRTKK